MKPMKLPSLASILFVLSLISPTMALGEDAQAMASRWRLETTAVQATLRIVNHGMEATPVWLMHKQPKGAISAAQKLAYLQPGERVTIRPDEALLKIDHSGFLELSASQHLELLVMDAEGKKMHAIAEGDSVTERNEQGIWFIRGGDLYDVHEMMGYNVAHDRFWQLAMYRRLGRGSLAEWYGAAFLSQDIQTRTLGYSETQLQTYFEALDADSRTLLTAYTAGINRRLAELIADPTLMPAELVLLGEVPVPFTPTDVMAFATVLQRSFSLPNLFGPVNNALMLQSLIAEHPPFSAVAMFLDAAWTNDPSAQTMIPVEPEGEEELLLKTTTYDPIPRLKHLWDVDPAQLAALAENLQVETERNRELLKSVGAYIKGGSFAWVVDGSRTQSGNPTIYSGPQMGFSMPVIVSEGAIVSDELNVSGMHVPLVPAIIVGRTPHHAWSFQVGHTHTADWYVEQPENVFVDRVETFQIRGADPVEVPIRFSQNGPILVSEPFLLALKYAHRGYEWSFGLGSLGLARAQTMEEFGEASSHIAASQHICYADADGNIAYWMAGRNPVRPPGDYRFPQGLFGPPAEYDTAVVHPLPHAANPTQGWFGGWNNRADPNLPDLTASNRYGLVHRAIEVESYLTSKDVFSFEELRDLFQRVVLTDSFMFGGNPWRFVGERFSSIVRAHPTPERLAALEVLQNWDGLFVDGGLEARLTASDRADGWVLAENWIRRVLALTFSDELPSSFGLSEENLLNMLARELNPEAGRRNIYRAWFRNGTDSSAPQTVETVILKALDETLDVLGERPWGTGNRQELVFTHPLFGELISMPWARHSTYAQVVEVGPAGPTRIESNFPVGQIHQVGLTPQSDLNFHPLYFAMHPFFSTFTPAVFPTFVELAVGGETTP